ncbi:MAG: glutaminyl-peptide cyclotransferase [Hyphomicrobiales bacterium]|nr:glutaminyl-peptide cyclotransferase [Hyphomicrobiales bacterium]
MAAFIWLTGTPADAMCRTDAVQVTTIARDDAVREIRKDHRYTQGLIVSDDVIFESTGQWGRSGLYAIDRETGRSTELAGMDDKLFGEGLARLGGRLFQLTWRSGMAFAYDIAASQGDSLPAPKVFRYSGEGWGLTNMQERLVLSDGTDTLRIIDPEDFSVDDRIEVSLGERRVDRLNELEMVEGLILANLYGEALIIAIDPATGCVAAVIDARPLVADMQEALRQIEDPVCGGGCNPLDFVLNGIAYDPDTSELFLTGKNWPLILVFGNPLALP